MGRNRVIWSLFIWIEIFLIVIHSHDTESLTTCIPSFLNRHHIPFYYLCLTQKTGGPVQSLVLPRNLQGFL